MIGAETHGLAEARAHLHAMRLRAGDLTPAWEELLVWWAVTNVEHFASRGRRWRTPWPGLAPRTVAQKRRDGFLSDPMVRTGRMRTEMTRRPLGMEHVTHNSVEAGTTAPYAKYHQSSAPRTHLPRRALVNMEAIAREGTPGSMVLTYIVDGTPNAGGHNVKLER